MNRFQEKVLKNLKVDQIELIQETFKFNDRKAKSLILDAEAELEQFKRELESLEESKVWEIENTDNRIPSIIGNFSTVTDFFNSKELTTSFRNQLHSLRQEEDEHAEKLHVISHQQNVVQGNIENKKKEIKRLRYFLLEDTK